MWLCSRRRIAGLAVAGLLAGCKSTVPPRSNRPPVLPMLGRQTRAPHSDQSSGSSNSMASKGSALTHSSPAKD